MLLLMSLIAHANEVDQNLHPTTGEKHTPMFSTEMEILEDVHPQWPQSAPAEISEIACAVRLYIDTAGKVTHASPGECAAPFDTVISDTLMEVTFEPVLVDGSAVPVVTVVQYAFTRPELRPGVVRVLEGSSPPMARATHRLIQGSVALVERDALEILKQAPLPEGCHGKIFFSKSGWLEVLDIESCDDEKGLRKAVKKWRIVPHRMGEENVPVAMAF